MLQSFIELINGNGVTGTIGILLGIVVSVAIYEYKRYRNNQSRASDNVTEWYDEAKNLVSRVTVEGIRQTQSYSLDPDEISDTITPLANRLFTHAKTAPDGVDSQSIELLEALAEVCIRTRIFAEIACDDEKSLLNFVSKKVQRGEVEDVDLDEMTKFLAEVDAEDVNIPSLDLEEDHINLDA
ncbi:hypothetical protein HUG10_05785 [Halorarum halophilum]|uniref:Uncharacterized protein n=1 Tax=Halorarum halophilum TaxID=2743090 RepID=A0A7D5GJW7_9EURY|nr:hypothetical protein [Halobaculum halophilum]QLG27084.1 hypothetical protein HUG10_05785 [Halobaculum halophilum]